MTTFLVGSGMLLASALQIHQGWAMMLTIVAAMALAAAAAVLGMARLRSSIESFRPAREELNRNLTWLRAVLVARGRSHTTPNRGVEET
jgi:hypothetical protein